MPLVSDSIIYEVVNFIIESEFNNFKADYSKCKYLMDMEDRPKLWAEDSLKLLQMDTLFNQDDLKFIFKQNNWAENFKINKYQLVNHIEIISRDTLVNLMGNNPSIFWERYYKKFGKFGTVSIGLPLFSIDKNTVIVTFSERYGALNGQRSTIIYKRINNNWKNIYLLRYNYS